MKTEVYSWRLTPAKKQLLENEARRASLTLSNLIELATQAWIDARRSPTDDAEQERLRSAALKRIGTLRGGDRGRSSNVRDVVRARLRRHHGR